MNLKALFFMLIFFVSLTSTSCAQQEDEGTNPTPTKNLPVSFENEDSAFNQQDPWNEYDPMDDLKIIQQRLRKMFEPLQGNRFSGPFADQISRAGFGSSIRADIAETDEGFIVLLDLPGYNKEDIELQLKNDVLLVEAVSKTMMDKNEEEDGIRVVSRERFQGSVRRVIRLPQPVKEDGILATYEAGVLEVMIPKAEAEKSVSIQIN